MLVDREIIDNSEGNKLVTFLNRILKETEVTNFDIATAFFNLKAFTMLRDNLEGVSHFRLLIGTTPEFKSNLTLGDYIKEELKKDVEELDLSKESVDEVQAFINFLNKENVEVRLYKKFLHGKAYLFDKLMITGSSNFTGAGLTRKGELNTWKLESAAKYTREEWFNKYWEESIDFKEDLIELLESSRFGNRKYSPYEVFIKTLYEFQKEDLKDIKDDAKAKGLPETKVNLAEFQQDAIARVLTRLKKYGGCIVADSVGLGKTWIAKKILEEKGYYERKNILVICPAQLREMWRKELKAIDVKENIISQEELASDDYLEKVKTIIGNRFQDLELIVVDESHNFRNPLTNRWENFFTLLSDHFSMNERPPELLFLTATPINNSPWDLYWQIMLLVLYDDRAFIKENIPELSKLFKKAANNPALLNDLLNEISIRRTRDYIIDNYPEAYINFELPDGKVEQRKIIFPERILQNVSYKLDQTYKGMYKEISDIITNKFTMAYYRILEYRKDELRTPEEAFLLGRMIAIGGIFRTILLKRLESSVDAFRISVKRHIEFLIKLKDYLNQGKLLTKNTFLKYLLNANEEIDIEEVKDELEKLDMNKYDIKRLFEDIDKDIELSQKILEKVKKISPEEDVKLIVLKELLLSLSTKEQIVVFAYYADTLNYIYHEIIKDERFSSLKIEAISSSGSTKKTVKQRANIIKRFFNEEVHILLSTDVLSEGENLQTAQFLINYDLHWNPTRMIQRAGRIDRLGSPFKKIYVYNFFPEDELEELLKLVEVLHGKIKDIDESIGLDQSILGEEINPKVFGIIRRIKEGDSTVFDELEREVFGGGELFYQPLKDFLKEKAIEDLEKIPFGIHSGLKKNKLSGIFYYYKYADDFHFWYLYDFAKEDFLTNKTEIIEYILCDKNEKRVIPDFFEKVYEINLKALEKLEATYKDIELSQKQDTKLRELSKSRSSKFVADMITEIEIQIDSYYEEFPEDSSIEEKWEVVRNRLLSLSLTKKRLQELRKIWREYKKKKNWRDLINSLEIFVIDKGIFKKAPVEPFDSRKLKLIIIDFIS